MSTDFTTHQSSPLERSASRFLLRKYNVISYLKAVVRDFRSNESEPDEIDVGYGLGKYGKNPVCRDGLWKVFDRPAMQVLVGNGSFSRHIRELFVETTQEALPDKLTPENLARFFVLDHNGDRSGKLTIASSGEEYRAIAVPDDPKLFVIVHGVIFGYQNCQFMRKVVQGFIESYVSNTARRNTLFVVVDWYDRRNLRSSAHTAANSFVVADEIDVFFKR